MNSQKEMKIKNSKFKYYFLSVLLILFFVTEAINKYTIFTIGEPVSFAKIVKGLVLVFCAGWITFINKLYREILIVILLFALFVLGQIFIAPNFNRTIILNVIKYFFPLILFLYFNNNQKEDTSLLLFLFEKIALVNSLCIIAGLVFSVTFFHTYGGSRFGYNGFLVSSATSTYFYFFILFHYFITYKHKLFNRIERIVVIASLVIVGTKSIYLLLLILAVLFFIYHIHSRWKLYMISFLSLLILGFLYFIFFKYDVFESIIKEKGVLASITSLRSEIIFEQMIPFIENNWDIMNYVVGGINNISTRPQMAFIDLFYFFGILGGIIYLKLYWNSFFNFRTNLTEKIFFALLFAICFISGNFFINATTVIYMLIIRESIKLNKNLLY